MSGGYWDYKNKSLAHEIFGWDMSVNYGKDGFNQAEIARRKNPLEDREISELVWDVMCLLHSYDYYESGDTSEKCYKNDVKYFKDKWFNNNDKKRIEAYKNDLRLYYEELINELDSM